MGKVTNLSFLSFEGTIGNLIIYKLKGKSYFRRKPESYNDAGTDEQLDHRNRLKAINRLSSLAMDDINKIIWKRKSRRLTAHNYFKKINFPFLDPVGKISQHEKLIFSVGDVPLPEEMKMNDTPSEDGLFTLTWSTEDVCAQQFPTSCLRIVILNNNDEMAILPVEATCNEGKATFELPCVSGTTIHLYAYFFNNYFKGSDGNYYKAVLIP